MAAVIDEKCIFNNSGLGYCFSPTSLIEEDVDM